VGGLFGGFVAALLAIPAAGAFQVIAREAWRLTGPPAAAEAEEQAVVAAAGDAAEEAAEVAEEAQDADQQAGSGVRATGASAAEIRVSSPEEPAPADAVFPGGRNARSARDLS
jgi:hypothetical protein